MVKNSVVSELEHFKKTYTHFLSLRDTGKKSYWHYDFLSDHLGLDLLDIYNNAEHNHHHCATCLHRHLLQSLESWAAM